MFHRLTESMPSWCFSFVCFRPSMVKVALWCNRPLTLIGWHAPQPPNRDSVSPDSRKPMRWGHPVACDVGTRKTAMNRLNPFKRIDYNQLITVDQNKSTGNQCNSYVLTLTQPRRDQHFIPSIVSPVGWFLLSWNNSPCDIDVQSTIKKPLIVSFSLWIISSAYSHLSISATRSPSPFSIN